jgi:hypothetical protein
MSSHQIAVRVDGAETDITGGVKVLYDSMLASDEWYGGLLCTREVLAVARLGRACGFAFDERTTRSAMKMVGIDPGPIWDRPLHAEPRPTPIRPEALTKYEALLDTTH